MLKRLLPDMNWRDWFTTDPKQVDWKRTILLVLLVLAVASSAWQYFMPQYRIITQNQFHPVPMIRGTAGIDRVRVACPESGIVVLDKKAIAKKLDLDWLQGGDIAGALAADKNSTITPTEVTSPSPEGTQPAADLRITATGDLPESDNGYEEVSVTDMVSGESQIMAREKESPWFQFRNDAALGIRYGLCVGASHDSPYCGDVYGKWDFLRLKDVYLSTNGDLSTDGSAKLQFG